MIFDRFPVSSKTTEKTIGDTSEIQTLSSPVKPRKNRYFVKKKDWRKDVITLELTLLVVFIFTLILLYFLDDIEYNF